MKMLKSPFYIYIYHLHLIRRFIVLDVKCDCTGSNSLELKIDFSSISPEKLMQVFERRSSIRTRGACGLLPKI